MELDLEIFYLVNHGLIALGMVAFLLGACEVGYRLGLSRKDEPDSLRALMSGTGASVLGLLGLMLGFTLSMAIARWDDRRDVIIDESNAIRTAWLRAGLLDDSLREPLEEALRAYTSERIALGKARSDPDALRAVRLESEALQVAIWSAVDAAKRTGTSPMAPLLIASATELMELHELRLASIENHLPSALLLLLLALGALAVGFLAWSFGAAHRSRAPILLLGILIGALMLLIMDVNRPQRGVMEVGVAPLERLAELVAAPRG